MKSTRAEVTLIILLVLALAGAGFFAFRPKATHGDSRRADESKAATVEVKTTVTATDTAQKLRSATAAASVVKMGEVAATLPASPEKEFITRETPVALSNLEAPDPAALLEAERRKSAILQGRYDEAAQLYQAATVAAQSKDAALAAANRARDAALARRDAIDSKLSEVAAARLAAERERARWMIVAGIAVLLWLYVKFTHLSPGALATAVNDIRGGKTDAITALDGVTSRTQQWMTSVIAHLKAR